MDIYAIRVASAIILAFLYMLFDLFNKRNVPDIFAYATLAYALVLSLLYMNIVAVEGIALALVIIGIGYLVYKAGQIGAADIIEFAAIAMIIPIQPAPWYSATNQLGLPFIFSVLVGTGIAALVIVPLYYLPISISSKKRITVSGKSLFKGILVIAAYLLFTTFIALVSHPSPYAIAMLAIVGIASSIIVAFEDVLTIAMVDYVGASKFEYGDIIAFNLMDYAFIKKMKKRVKNFDRLVTPELIAEMKKKGIRKKFPVYKHAMPLALAIFIGVIASLAFGNLLLLLFPGM
ncbi:MAG: hypothetical protein ACP5RM_01480 [Candidatus Micrarchaeia archaeon]